GTLRRSVPARRRPRQLVGWEAPRVPPCRTVGPCPEGPMPRPNILFLIADDHRHDVLGSAGSPVRTPQLDALAARGTRLARHHCQGGMTGAICAPSRASILSGREVLAATAGLGIGTSEAHEL